MSGFSRIEANTGRVKCPTQLRWVPRPHPFWHGPQTTIARCEFRGITIILLLRGHHPRPKREVSLGQLSLILAPQVPVSLRCLSWYVLLTNWSLWIRRSIHPPQESSCTVLPIGELFLSYIASLDTTPHGGVDGERSQRMSSRK